MLKNLTHPNPADEYTVIDLVDSREGEFLIYNTLGAVVATQPLAESQPQSVVNTSNWESGVY